MRKRLCFSAILFVMGGVYTTAMASDISVGVVGGLNMPIAQDDAGTGSLFGAKLRIAANSFLAVEPVLTFYGLPAPSSRALFVLEGSSNLTLPADLVARLDEITLPVKKALGPNTDMWFTDSRMR